MAALSNAVFGIVVLGLFLLQDAVASNAFSVAIPMNREISSMQGKKCMALRWDGVCDPVAACRTRFKVTLSKQSTSVINDIPLFHPFTFSNNKSQAVCFYDNISGENVSCCNDIIPGLSTGNALSFSDFEKVNFEISTCHLNDTIQCPSVESTFLLPWRDECLLYKPCGDEGSCNNDMKSGYSNCSCSFHWKGNNCTIPKDFTPYTHKCLKDVKGIEELVGKAMKDCVKRCEDLGNTKCKSFEFKPTLERKGNCTLKDANTDDNKLVDCMSDYFQITALLKTPSGQGSSMTAVFATCYILLAFLSSFVLME